MPSDCTGVLSTTRATTLVPVCPERAWSELLALGEQLWPGCVRTVDSRAPRSTVQALACTAGGEPDGWLTWALEPVDAGTTRVELVHDEQACGGPPPELDGVLALLLRRCLPAPSPAG